MPKPTKVTIGICTGGTVRAETVSSLVSSIVTLAQNNIGADLLIQIGGYVAINRNAIVRTAIGNGSTHLMFLDADHIFPADGMLKLLNHNKDIVASNYNVRSDALSVSKSGPTIKMLVDGEIVSATELPDSLFKCYAAGTGFMMINLGVFKKLRKPWFVSKEDSKFKHITEDIYFCVQANKAGFEVWCDPTIEVGHIGTALY